MLSASELALVELRELQRSHKFATLLSDAKRSMPRTSALCHSVDDIPSYDAAVAQALAAMGRVDRDDKAPEAILKLALQQLASHIIPAMIAHRTWRTESRDDGREEDEIRAVRGFHLFQGTWWPYALDERIVERIPTVWSGTIQPFAEDADTRPRVEQGAWRGLHVHSRAAHVAACARSDAYVEADRRWCGDDDNELKHRAEARGVPTHIFIHSSHLRAFDLHAVEEARGAALAHARAVAARYEANDADAACRAAAAGDTPSAATTTLGKDGMVDWAKTRLATDRMLATSSHGGGATSSHGDSHGAHAAPVMEVPRFATSDSVLRRLSLQPAMHGPRASLRHVTMPAAAGGAVGGGGTAGATGKATGANRHAYVARTDTGQSHSSSAAGGGSSGVDELPGARREGAGGMAAVVEPEGHESMLRAFLSPAGQSVEEEDEVKVDDEHDAAASRAAAVAAVAACAAATAEPTSAAKKKKNKAGRTKRLSSIVIPLWAQQLAQQKA